MEQNKPETTKVKATSQQQSWLQDAGKDLYDNYIVPKVTEIMHTALAGIISMFADTAQAGLDKEFKKHGWNGITKPITTTNNNYNAISRTITSSASNIIDLNNRSATNVRLIFVDTNADASTLIQGLKEDIINYRRARVGDLYERVEPKIPTTYVDFQYGWTQQHINQLGFRQIFTSEFGEDKRNKFLLELPTPVNIVKI
jgi:hypothetical protein